MDDCRKGRWLRTISLILLIFISNVAIGQHRLHMRIGGGTRIYAHLTKPSTSANIAIQSDSLTWTASGGGIGVANMGKSSGKWYWEGTLTTKVAQIPTVGIANFVPLTSNSSQMGTPAGTTGWRGQPQCITSGGTFMGGTGCTAQANGQVISIAFDIGAGTCSFYVNGTFQYTLTGIAAGTWYPGIGAEIGSTCTMNFGQNSWSANTATLRASLESSGYTIGVF